MEKKFQTKSERAPDLMVSPENFSGLSGLGRYLINGLSWTLTGTGEDARGKYFIAHRREAGKTVSVKIRRR